MKLTPKNETKHKTVLFEAAPFAYHEGDWEHVIIKLNEEQTAISHMGLSAHGHVPLEPIEQCQLSETGNCM